MAKKRDRAERRKRERDLRKLARKREQLVKLEAGGSPERPVHVVSAALVESRALGEPCHQCSGRVALVDHDVVFGTTESLRRVVVQCRACHARRTWYFAISPPRAN